MSRLSQNALVIGIILLGAACATISPVSRIEAQLIDLGVSNARAECLAETLDEELERDDLNAVANFLEGLNRVETPGEALNALLSIDNPRAAAAVAASGIACAFSR